MNAAIDLVSPERLQRIKELAQKATPGPWIDYEGSIYQKNEGCFWIADVGRTIEDRQEERAYIAAAHPGVILTMCAEIERLRERVALLNKEAEWLAEHMPKTSMIDGKAKVQCLRGMQEWRETARKAVEEGHHA